VAVLASLADEPEFNALRAALDAEDAIDAATFSGDIESSKPAPDPPGHDHHHRRPPPGTGGVLLLQVSGQALARAGLCSLMNGP
jgi:hypothetical protein